MITDQPIGSAVLYVLSNVQPHAHAAFTEWCNSIHHFDTMRIEGFLSLRRFELVTGTVEPGVTQYRLLTLYQIADRGVADFSTPAYQQHTATYTPAPEGVTDGIEFERHVMRRRQAVAGRTTQPVGEACVSLVGSAGPWIEHAANASVGLPGVLNAHLVDGDDRSALLVDVESSTQGADVLSMLSNMEHGGQRQSVQLMAQVFPRVGVLGRDRHVISPRS